MAIPIVIGAVAIGSAAYGAYKGGKGAIDNIKAKNTNKEANSIVEKARRKVEEHRSEAAGILEQYGKRKLRAFDGVIADFIQTFGRLKNVEVESSPELEKLQVEDFSKNTLVSLRGDYQALKDAGLGIGTGATSGAALAFGAYNGTMMLATASTGTAISSLSGAAATNATLAWLGGGSIASGGGGIALGTSILGGIAVGPALAIFGHVFGNKAEEALNNANSNIEQAKTVHEEAALAVTKLEAITQVTELADSTLSKVIRQLRRAVHALSDIIDHHGEDFSSFDHAARDMVFKAVKQTQLIKALIDTPILDDEGKLVLSTQKRITDVSEAVES